MTRCSFESTSRRRLREVEVRLRAAGCEQRDAAREWIELAFVGRSVDAGSDSAPEELVQRVGILQRREPTTSRTNLEYSQVGTNVFCSPRSKSSRSAPCTRGQAWPARNRELAAVERVHPDSWVNGSARGPSHLRREDDRLHRLPRIALGFGGGFVGQKRGGSTRWGRDRSNRSSDVGLGRRRLRLGNARAVAGRQHVTAARRRRGFIAVMLAANLAPVEFAPLATFFHLSPTDD